jgi:hypothetical protein
VLEGATPLLLITASPFTSDDTTVSNFLPTLGEPHEAMDTLN